MPVAQRKLLGQILVEEGLLSEPELAEALDVQRQNGGAVGRVLIDLGMVTENDIQLAVARQAGMDVIDL